METCQPRILYQENISFKKNGRINSFWYKCWKNSPGADALLLKRLKKIQAPENDTTCKYGSMQRKEEHT